jgi:hypothetical protein
VLDASSRRLRTTPSTTSLDGPSRDSLPSTTLAHRERADTVV